MSTNGYVRGVNEIGWEPFAGRLWQRNYYEHVIRDAAEHENIHNYIESNPRQWATDEMYPSRIE